MYTTIPVVTVKTPAKSCIEKSGQEAQLYIIFGWVEQP